MPRNRDEPPRRDAALRAVERIAARYPQMGVVYAQDYEDLRDNRQMISPLAALAVVAAEVEAARAGHPTGNPAVEDDDLAAGLALASVADNASAYAELVILAALRHRGHGWPAIARARGYRKPEVALTRFDRLRARFPNFQPPGAGTPSEATRRARHLVALADTENLPHYFINEARRLLASLLYAAALADVEEAAVRAWVTADAYDEPIRAVEGAMTTDPAPVVDAIREHAQTEPALRARMDELLISALTNGGTA